MKLDRMKLVGGDIADMSVPDVGTLPAHVSKNALLAYQGELRQGKNDNWATIPTKRNGVGPQQLVGGDASAGFYGLVPASELIDGPTLKQRAGVSGTTVRPLENWMKFSIDGKIIFVAMEPPVRDISWDQLAVAEVVYGNKELTIGDYTYRVRLLKGANVNPTANLHGTDAPEHTDQSEWDLLMYRTCNYKPAGQGLGNWAQYTQLQLHCTSSAGDGRATWCQESVSGTSEGLIRGYQRIDLIYTYPKNMAHDDFGWRPVLEIVS